VEQFEIETQGHRALVLDHCQLAKRVQVLVELEMALAETVTLLEGRIAEVEYLLSEEIMANLTPPDVRETVADLGHGWRIERQPAPPNAVGATYTPSHVALETGTPYPVAATGTPGDSWLPVADCWVTQFAAAVDKMGGGDESS
jgi:hypothetical protein